MKYKVIVEFKDKDGTLHKANREYKGSKAKARLKELTTDQNKYGYPFIEEVDDDVDKE